MPGVVWFVLGFIAGILFVAAPGPWVPILLAIGGLAIWIGAIQQNRTSRAHRE